MQVSCSVGEIAMIDSAKGVKCFSFWICLGLCVLCVQGFPVRPAMGVIVIDGDISDWATTPGRSVRKVSVVSASPHLPREGTINFNRGYHSISDGGGYLWDIQNTGGVRRGTQNAYGGGMQIRVHGQHFYSNTNNGWSNKAGDEIEMGPRNMHGVNIYRRIKVYKDRPLARWLDILENTTAKEVIVPVNYRTQIPYSIASKKSSSGDAVVDDKDFAFWTKTRGPRVPSTLHVVNFGKTKIKPKVTIIGNQITYQYNLKIPAGKTVILCHFESQNRDTNALDALMTDFPAYKLLKDLPRGVRKMILNMKVFTGIGGVKLERRAGSGVVHLRQAAPLFGTIMNESFSLKTRIGLVKLSAGKVVGMAGRNDGGVAVVLTDGQVLTTDSSDIVLQVKLSGGSILKVPVRKVRQWSYGISKSRPEEIAFTRPYVMLESGDSLMVAAETLDLTFLTRNGKVKLDARSLLSVSTEAEDNGVHVARFRNGSVLSGILLARKLRLKSLMGPEISVPVSQIRMLRFSDAQTQDDLLTRMELTNGDRLFGSLCKGSFKLTTDYGKVDVKSDRIRRLNFHPGKAGRVTLRTWDGTSLTGWLGQATLEFRVAGDTKLSVHAGQCAQILSPTAMPAEETRKKVEQLIAQLGSESYQERQVATRKLMKMGRVIKGILLENLDCGDPEVRQRLEEVLTAFAANR